MRKMKSVLLVLVMLIVVAVQAQNPTWSTSAESAYRQGQGICYDASWGMSGDAAHVAAADRELAGTGVTFLQLAAFRDQLYPSGIPANVTMSTVWYFTYGGAIGL